MMTKTQRDEFASRAERAYAEHLKQLLEPEHLGKLIAVEPDSGDYVLGKDLWELEAERERMFGSKLVHIFRVGGGPAVRIGGAFRQARLSG